MADGILVKVAQNLKQRPFLSGCVIGLPLSIVILVVLKKWPTVGWSAVGIWLVLSHFWIRRPVIIQTTWAALFVGMLLALVIWQRT